jgi:hypothetical protein
MTAMVPRADFAAQWLLQNLTMDPQAGAFYELGTQLRRSMNVGGS